MWTSQRFDDLFGNQVKICKYENFKVETENFQKILKLEGMTYHESDHEMFFREESQDDCDQSNSCS